MPQSVANQWVSTVKDTSLAYIVSVVELSTAASQVNSRTVAYPAEVFAAVAVRYFVLCSGIELLPRWLRGRCGEAGFAVGTRNAVAPFPALAGAAGSGCRHLGACVQRAPDGPAAVGPAAPSRPASSNTWRSNSAPISARSTFASR